MAMSTSQKGEPKICALFVSKCVAVTHFVAKILNKDTFNVQKA
jgi:hypothetical protein